MNGIGRIVMTLLAAVFTLLFIFPAILFSVLVIGMTESWRWGTAMLATAVLLLIIMNYQVRSYAPSRRKNDQTSYEASDFSEWENELSQPIPPPISDLYFDLRERELETEKVYRTIVESNADRYAKTVHLKDKGNNTTPY